MSYSQKVKNNKILIVDDEQDVLDILKLYLGSQGWVVDTALSPLLALQSLENDPHFLVITDIAMPDMDGYEFITKMKDILVPSEIALMTGFGYNPKHTLVKINKRFKYPIFFKPFDFKTPKIFQAVKDASLAYHIGME